MITRYAKPRWMLKQCGHGTPDAIRILLVAGILILFGCAGQPERTTFADIAAKNESLKVSYPKRVILALDADCDEQDICTLPAQNIQAAVDIVTSMNDENEKRIDAYNALLQGLNHCEYANAKLSESVGYLESGIQRSEITSQVKQIVTALTCGVILWSY